MQALDVAAGEAEDGREQRHRRRHDDQHGEHHREGEPVHGRLSHQQDAEHRDDHGQAGEQHGAAGGGDRGPRGPSGILAVGQAAAEPRDDQQRVVDADADADHGRGVRRPLRYVDNPAQHLAERHRDAESEQRRDEGQPHRNDGAEGDEQDDGRRDQADALGARGNRLGLGRDRAADLDLQRLVAGREDGRDQRRGLVGRELVGGLVEGDVGVRRGGVRGDLARPLWRERAGDAHDVLGVSDIGQDRLDPLDQLRRGHAGVGVDDDLHGVARLLREAVLERVGDALRLRARLEVVLLELPSERAGQREGTDQCGYPGQDHETAVPEAPISETYQHRDSFIGSSVVCLRR